MMLSVRPAATAQSLPQTPLPCIASELQCMVQELEAQAARVPMLPTESLSDFSLSPRSFTSASLLDIGDEFAQPVFLSDHEIGLDATYLHDDDDVGHRDDRQLDSGGQRSMRQGTPGSEHSDGEHHVEGSNPSSGDEGPRPCPAGAPHTPRSDVPIAMRRSYSLDPHHEQHATQTQDGVRPALQLTCQPPGESYLPAGLSSLAFTQQLPYGELQQQQPLDTGGLRKPQPLLRMASLAAISSSLPVEFALHDQPPSVFQAGVRSMSYDSFNFGSSSTHSLHRTTGSRSKGGSGDLPVFAARTLLSLTELQVMETSNEQDMVVPLSKRRAQVSAEGGTRCYSNSSSDDAMAWPSHAGASSMQMVQLPSSMAVPINPQHDLGFSGSWSAASAAPTTPAKHQGRKHTGTSHSPRGGSPMGGSPTHASRSRGRPTAAAAAALVAAATTSAAAASDVVAPAVAPAVGAVAALAADAAAVPFGTQFYELQKRAAAAGVPVSTLMDQCVMPGAVKRANGAARSRKRTINGVPTPPKAPAPNPHGHCCTQCGTQTTPVWRAGPHGPKSLCNACGVRYMKGLAQKGGVKKVK